MTRALAACALAVAACTRALDPAASSTVLVLAPPPKNAAAPVQIVAEDGDDPAVGVWGTHASFEDVARVTMDDAGDGVELSFDSLLEPLADEALLAACGATEGAHVRARVAVLRGRAIGVTVEVEPDDPELAGCLDRRIRSLAWETSDRVQYVVKTW